MAVAVVVDVVDLVGDLVVDVVGVGVVVAMVVVVVVVDLSTMTMTWPPARQ